MKIKRVCLTCGKDFYLYHSQLKCNAGKYCSRQCTKTGVPASDPSIRFWKYVDKTDYCWNWTGAKHKFGYGAFNVQGKVYTGHTYSWLLTHGVLPPKGKEIMHICDNPACVNPAHLKLGTQAENMLDCYLKNRHSKGESKSKLKEIEVRAIRMLHASHSGYSARKLSKIFNISQGHTSAIISRRTWKHI